VALRLLAFALALGLWLVLAAPPASKPPLIETTAARSVTIATLPCARSLQSTSSGVVFDDELVVTVAHAIWDSRDFAVQDSTGLWHEASVLHLDRELDLAVLRVPDLDATPMTTRRAENADPVRMLDGSASGTVYGEVLRRVNITTAIVGDLSVTSERSGYELTIPIAGGDSGAAVLDVDDNLVGLIFARSTRRDASWAVSITELNQVVDLRTMPRWECERESDRELILDPPELEDDRLA
jgi:S1-C subfamily serine protease